MSSSSPPSSQGGLEQYLTSMASVHFICKVGVIMPPTSWRRCGGSMSSRTEKHSAQSSCLGPSRLERGCSEVRGGMSPVGTKGRGLAARVPVPRPPGRSQRAEGLSSWLTWSLTRDVGVSAWADSYCSRVQAQDPPDCERSQQCEFLCEACPFLNTCVSALELS